MINREKATCVVLGRDSIYKLRTSLESSKVRSRQGLLKKKLGRCQCRAIAFASFRFIFGDVRTNIAARSDLALLVPEVRFSEMSQGSVFLERFALSPLAFRVFHLL
jgi:hypothetical protein